MSIDIRIAKKTFHIRQQNNLEKREFARKKALKEVRIITPRLATRYPSIKAVYLFGSILRPGAFYPPKSDIDIAIEGGSAEDYFSFWHALEDSLSDWLIDLRDLPDNSQFTQRVRELGERIYG